MISVLAVALGGLLLLLVIPAWQQLCYRFVLWRRNYYAPKTYHSPPFGIPRFIETLRAKANDNLPRYFNNMILTSGRLTSRQQVLGRYVFLTCEPENIKTVLATRFDDWGLGIRWNQLSPLLGDGIFTLDGKGWSHSRAMLRPQFARDQISRVALLEEHAKKLVGHLRGYPLSDNGQAYVDVQEKFFELTMDTATEFLFGESVGLLDGGNPRVANGVEFGKAFNRGQEMLLARNIAQGLYPLVTSAGFRRDCRTCKDFTDSFVKLALARRAQHVKEKMPAAKEEEDESTKIYVFLDELVKETTDPVVLRDQALNILLAGRDTTASLLSWIFLQLAEHPAEFEKLRAEILASFGPDASTISFETLKRCTYLRYVINETLRLYPTVPLNFRVATRNTLLPRGAGPDGSEPLYVPGGTILSYSTYSLHRHPSLWGPDADEFRPERWADPKTARHTWAYLPFNGGPRICLGQQFALTETSYTVVRLLQEFRSVRLRPDLRGKQPRLKHALTMNVGDGVPLQFESA